MTADAPGIRRVVAIVAALNLTYLAVALVTVVGWTSIWADLIVGVAITALNIDAARDIWNAAVAERRAAHA